MKNVEKWQLSDIIANCLEIKNDVTEKSKLIQLHAVELDYKDMCINSKYMKKSVTLYHAENAISA